MLMGKSIAVVMPAYNASKTLEKTYNEVKDQGIVDIVIIVDDKSEDGTLDIAKRLPDAIVYAHEKNIGYGGNQKNCYRMAIEYGADIIIMVHPDYQYTPKLIPAMASMIASNLYHCVLGSRILGGYAIKGGMPIWKYVSNRILTMIQNVLLHAKLSEFHTGYRAFSRELLLTIPMEHNDNGFVFDNQMLSQIIWSGYLVAEISCPTKYFAEASSINLYRSIEYGLGCLKTALEYRLSRMRLIQSNRFQKTVNTTE